MAAICSLDVIRKCCHYFVGIVGDSINLRGPVFEETLVIDLCYWIKLWIVAALVTGARNILTGVSFIYCIKLNVRFYIRMHIFWVNNIGICRVSFYIGWVIVIADGNFILKHTSIWIFFLITALLLFCSIFNIW